MSKPPEKFLFNRHNFDHGTLDLSQDSNETKPQQENQPAAPQITPEPEPPQEPEPTFNEDDLEKARQEGFKEGLQQGKQDQQTQQSDTIQSLLNAIDAQLPALMLQESERIKKYEQETLLLTQIIFKKLFPHYTNAHGLNELTQSIKNILASQSDTPNIKISVAKDIEKMLDSEISKLDNAKHISIQSIDTLSKNAFEITWPNGGASMNIDKIQHDIQAILEEAAPTAQNNTTEETNS